MSSTPTPSGRPSSPTRHPTSRPRRGACPRSGGAGGPRRARGAGRGVPAGAGTDASRHRHAGAPAREHGSAAACQRRTAAPARALTPAPVAINARAAMRREIGGVERWARELAERLPRLRPERYRVIRPRPRSRTAPGSLGAARAAARGAQLRAAALTGEPRAAGRPPNVVVIHDAAAFQDPAWYGRAYGSWHRLLVPRVARRARLVIAPSEYVREELVGLFGLDPERVRAVPPGVDDGLQRPVRPGRAAAAARPRTALRAGRGHRQPAQEPRAARSDRPRARVRRPPGGDRGLGAPLPAALRGGHRAAARLRARRRPPGALRGRGGVRDAVALRGLRPALHRGDGSRHARRGLGPGRAARGVRRCRAARGPGRPGRLRRGAHGGRRYAAQPPGRGRPRASRRPALGEQCGARWTPRSTGCSNGRRR